MKNVHSGGWPVKGKGWCCGRGLKYPTSLKSQQIPQGKGSSKTLFDDGIGESKYCCNLLLVSWDSGLVWNDFPATLEVGLVWNDFPATLEEVGWDICIAIASTRHSPPSKSIKVDRELRSIPLSWKT